MMKQKLLKFYSFTEEMKKQGKVPESKILSFREKKADEKISKELNIDAGENIFELVRLRIADGEEVMYEKTYLPAKKFPNLSKKDLLKIHYMVSLKVDISWCLLKLLKGFQFLVQTLKQQKY